MAAPERHPGTHAGAAAPQASAHSTAEAEQAKLNKSAGPRFVPAKILPVPDLDPGTAALVAAPYSEIWNLAPGDGASWREVLYRAAEDTLPSLASARDELGVSMRPTKLGGVPAFILEPKAGLPPDHARQIVLHLHGGGFVFGAGGSGTGEAALLASHCGYRVISLDYRMPPDAPFPAALEDATAAWRALVTTTNPSRIGIEGTSAGGGLALALMLRCKADGLPMPASLALGSPFADLTDTGDSLRTNEWVDNVLVTYDAYVARVARLYADGKDLRDRYLSPVYGDLSGLPPTVLISGTRDLFLSTTIRVHRKLLQSGGDADLHVFEGLSHAQFTFGDTAPVTQEVYQQIGRFFERHLAR